MKAIPAFGEEFSQLPRFGLEAGGEVRLTVEEFVVVVVGEVGAGGGGGLGW